MRCSRSAATLSANGSNVPPRPTASTRQAICGSVRTSNGQPHSGSSTAQMTAATTEPMNSVVTGCAPRMPTWRGASVSSGATLTDDDDLDRVRLRLQLDGPVVECGDVQVCGASRLEADDDLARRGG
jgi:hypothetical protein